MIEPAPGVILISEPFLRDPNFMRTAVFLCEHNAEGSFGFVLNRPFEQGLEEFIPNLKGVNIPVFYGGPVQPDTLHFLHHIPELEEEAQQVLPGVFWGGDFRRIIHLIKNQMLDVEKIRFFLGYSGWTGGQLEGEMQENSWLTVQGTQPLVFHNNPGDLWKDAVKQLDETYHPIIHYPIDPQLNKAASNRKRFRHAEPFSIIDLWII